MKIQIPLLNMFYEPCNIFLFIAELFLAQREFVGIYTFVIAVKIESLYESLMEWHQVWIPSCGLPWGIDKPGSVAGEPSRRSIIATAFTRHREQR
jgi:hypothetical protein